MRGEKTYLWQRAFWPNLTFDASALIQPLAEFHEQRGRLHGSLEPLAVPSRDETALRAFTLDAVRTSLIEGETLDETLVRSSFARRLGIDEKSTRASTRSVDGLVELLLDVVRGSHEPLTVRRMLEWHTRLFAQSGRAAARLEVGKWRTAASGPMQVVSGPIGRQRVHFEAPPPTRLAAEMSSFVNWFESIEQLDPAVKAGLAHLRFVTVHPFADGNGRIARALGDLVLARADGEYMRFYSVSSQIADERDDYYRILESTQRGECNVTKWLTWFIACATRAVQAARQTAREVASREESWKRISGIPLNDRQSRILKKLLHNFKGNLTSTKWAKLTKCSPDTALRDLQDLLAKGVLVRSISGGRSTSYVLP